MRKKETIQKIHRKQPLIRTLLMACMVLSIGGCGTEKNTSEEVQISDNVIADDKLFEEKEEMEVMSLKKVEVQSGVKALTDHNPVMVQRFGADPYALVYDGRVYLYMTGDKISYNPDKTVKENTYGNIDTINVISSDDLVNWTDHGTVYAAGKNGAAKWGPNSWAPAAAYKKIDGKDKFFLYFANNGNGIGVLSSDSPVGPFVDEIGKPLISRETPNCAEVTWLFDPAVLMDDDGEAYIYVGGGVPSPDKASNPGTARVAKLGEDMMSLDGDPMPIENVDFLFEDSGINKINGTYYYSYCSNFSVDPVSEKELGFGCGEIITMKSDSPMGPFTRCRSVLKNPEAFFGLGGNNHHCMFEFDGQWYITYHSRILEKKMGINGGYRSTNVDKLVINKDGEPAASVGTRAGVKQVKAFDPYKENKAVTMSNAAGVTTKQFGEISEKCGSGDMIVSGITDGAWTNVTGVDFGADGAEKITFNVIGKKTDVNGTIRVCLGTPSAEPAAVAVIEGLGKEMTEVTATFAEKVTGQQNIYFVFEGQDYDFYTWQAE